MSGERYYRIWDYSVSHDQLLLRSPRDAQHNTNVDLVFVGVEYIELPNLLRGVEVCGADAAEHARVERVLGKSIAASRVFVLKSGARRFLVAAAAMKQSENDLDFMESSLESFGRDS